MNKSNDSSKNSAYFNNNTEGSELKNMAVVKNYKSSYPLVGEGNNLKYKGAIKLLSNNINSKNKKEIFYPKMRNEPRNTKNYSSMLKRQFFEEQLFNANKNNKNL